MKIVVKFHESAREDHFEWCQRLIRSATGNAEVARIHEKTLIDELVRTRGFPSGVVRDPDADPPQWVWRFSSDTTVRYTASDSFEGWVFGERVRTVLIREIRHTPRGG